MDSGPKEQIEFNDDTALIYAIQHGYYQLVLDLNEVRRRINLNIINLKHAHETSKKKEAESDLSDQVNLVFSNAGTALTQSPRANNHAETNLQADGEMDIYASHTLYTVNLKRPKR